MSNMDTYSRVAGSLADDDQVACRGRILYDPCRSISCVREPQLKVWKSFGHRPDTNVFFASSRKNLTCRKPALSNGESHLQLRRPRSGAREDCCQVLEILVGMTMKEKWYGHCRAHSCTSLAHRSWSFICWADAGSCSPSIHYHNL